MAKHTKALSTVLQDALISISDEDSRESHELLLAAGINSEAVVYHSMTKIEQLQRSFENRLAVSSEAEQIKTLSARIKDFVARSPERANNFLNSYFQQHEVPVRFAATTGFNRKKLEEVKGKIDMDDLSSKLDDEANR